jgi:REP element-mobilizing transposase RayT
VGERLFRDEHDLLRFEMEAQKLGEQGDCICIAACTLTTHYHLILETTADRALASAMKRLNQRYAVAFNARYGRRGHAFAERYVSVTIANDAQLLTTYRYVARNPVEAGVCGSPTEWEWSSYPAAIGFKSRFAWADATRVIGCCDGAVESLRRFVETNSGVRPRDLSLFLIDASVLRCRACGGGSPRP